MEAYVDWKAYLEMPRRSSRDNIWVQIGTVYSRITGRVVDVEQVPLGEKFDAAIAIGIGVLPDGQGPNARSFGNVQEAYKFWQTGRAKHMILSGGNSLGLGRVGNALVEAEAMAVPLKAVGVPAHAYTEETLSRNTYENAVRALEIMHRRNFRSAVIFGEAIHAGRVAATFRKQWKGTGIRFIVVRTYGAYGDSVGRFTTPLPFLSYNTMASVISKKRGWS